MTRKDYVLIAAQVRDMLLFEMQTQAYLDGAKAAHNSIAYRLAGALGQTNPRFDRERFLKACGVT